MNDFNPETAPFESPAEAYYDRTTGLRVFGALTIGLGGLCGLLVPLMLIGQMMAAKMAPDQPQMNTSALIPALIMYAVLAVALIWLGVGSLMTRRWARALLLIFSWSWLIVGVFAMIVMAIMLPTLAGNLDNLRPKGQPAAPASAMWIGLLFGCVIDGFILVVLPAVWTFFYSSRHVRLTCEWRDPVPRWTDAIPLPVLAFALLHLVSGISMLFMPLTTHGVMPFFGTFLSGFPGSIFCVASGALFLIAAGLWFRVDIRGWWLIVVMVAVYLVSGVITYSRHNILEMYRLMDYPPAQIEQLQKMGLMTGNWLMWGTLIFALPFFGYLLWVRKYFRPVA